MDLRELRLGNLVYQSKKWGEPIEKKNVEWDDSNWYRIGECLSYPEDFEPIHLTEEWLVILGAEHQSGNVYKIGLLYFWWDSKTLKLILSGTEFEFVHEVQNVCFILTGKELTIKQ